MTNASLSPGLGWLSDFSNPPSAFRAIPFWSLNERLAPAEMVAQVGWMQQAGFGGVLLHARVGLLTPYLGDEWMEACAAAIAECKRLGMNVWLYDEDGWPSGFSGGHVPLLSERYRHKALCARPPGDPAPADTRPLGAPAHGLQLYVWTAPLGSARFNGASYTDVLDAEAVQAFIDHAYASYHRRFACEYGGAITAEFLDEPCALMHVGTPAGVVPFTPGLPEAFRVWHGYDPLPLMHLLFQDGPGCARFRLHYFRTVSRLFEQNFTGQISDWCQRHGLALTGHYWEGSLFSQQRNGNAIMPNYRHQHIPGIDHLLYQTDEILTAKQCQSVVNQYDKPRMLCELFGGAGQGLTFEDRLWITLHLMQMGVNQLTPHLCLYTMAGERKRDWPPNLSYQQPWFERNHALEIPLARMCVALAQGRYVADVLVLHPQDSVTVTWRMPAAEDESGLKDLNQLADSIDADLHAIMHALMDAQRGFDLGDETILAAVGGLADGKTPRLRVGSMSYAAVVVPTMFTMTGTTLALLRRFADAGGLIVRCGIAPTLVDGESSDDLAAFMAGLPVVAADELAAQLAPYIPAAVRCAQSAGLRSHVRDLADGERLVFVANLDRAAHMGERELLLGGGYTGLVRLDPTSGEQHPVPALAQADGLRCRLPLGALEHHLLRLTRAPVPTAAAVPTWEAPIALPDHHWTVERLDDNALVLDRVRWREHGAVAFTRDPIPVISLQRRLNDIAYRGPLDLAFTFRCDGLTRTAGVRLALEYPQRYRITVNGSEVRCAGLPCYRDIRLQTIDIGHLVQAGENEIRLTLDAFVPGDPTSTHDQAARYGTEVEAVYVIGDFHVHAVIATGPTVTRATPPWRTYTPAVDLGLSYFAADSFALGDPRALTVGDVTPQGLPFYAGRVRWRCTLPAGLPACRLTLAVLDAPVATVEADGKHVADLVARPFHVHLPANTHELALTFYSSLRNLLGPYHHPTGDPVNAPPWAFEADCGAPDVRPARVATWAAGTDVPPDYRSTYACRAFARVQSLALQPQSR